HIAALRKALDEDGSQPSCIATVIGRGYRFVEPVLDCGINSAVEDGEPMDYVSSASGRLFGRAEVVSRLKSLIERNRMVTLVGSPGIGKTAVSSAVEEMMRHRFEHGSCLVDLGAVTDPNHAPAVIAEALSDKFGVNKVEIQPLQNLRAAKMLIVLDGC